jgi:hypothetical protein
MLCCNKRWAKCLRTCMPCTVPKYWPSCKHGGHNCRKWPLPTASLLAQYVDVYGSNQDELFK